MKCWICGRQARGFLHTDGRYGVGDVRRYVADWVFCSMRCMHVFHVAYQRWERALRDAEDPKEFIMVDASDIERAAMRRCLRYFGEAAGEIGYDKPLGAYSEVEALKVIEAIVTAYTEAMVMHHEQTMYPPVRGLGKPTRDPFDANLRQAQKSGGTGFEDMRDDLPWEDAHA
jgi:hypothetical protein